MTASERAEFEAPAFLSAPRSRRTLGPEVADLAEMAGFPPDEEQRLILDLIFAMDDDDGSAAFEVAVACARQNLKTGVFKQAALGWLFLTEQRLIIWSAHEFNTSAEAFRDLEALIDGCGSLSRLVKAIHRGHGHEKVELTSGARLVFRTRTVSGARGLSGDKVVLDEAMFLQPGHMGALLPTMSAREDAQVVYGGSAGLLDSKVWRDVRNRGRPGSDPRLAYVEWCDDLGGTCATESCTHRLTAVGCRLDDRRRWKRANPTMGRRISEEHIAAERRAMPAEEFARERLSWWDDPDEDMEEFLELWAACGHELAMGRGQPVFGLDASPGGRSAAIVAVMPGDDGNPFVEVVDHHPGTDWVVERCRHLQSAHNPRRWVLDPAGPAGGLLPELTKVGLEPHQMTAREMGQGCEILTGLVRKSRLSHQGDPDLAQALVGASRRDLGDGLWLWSRKKSGSDICPLVATTAAVWGYTSADTGTFFAGWR